MMQKLKFNVIYELDFSNFHIPFLTKEETLKVCKNGSFMSRISEPVGAKIFGIVHENGVGYDYPLQEGVEKQLDQKTFTTKGLKFMQSYMIGAGRKFDKEEFDRHVRVTDYLITDITNFPKLRFIVRSGIELAEDFPRGSVSLAKIKKVFKPEYERVIVNEEEINTENNEGEKKRQEDFLGSILHKEGSSTKDSRSYGSEIQLMLF